MKGGITGIHKSGNITAPAISDYQVGSVFKAGITYAVMCIAIAALISFVFGTMIVPGMTGIRSAVVPAVCFILLGFFFAISIYSKFTFLSTSDDTSRVVYVSIVVAGIFAALMLTSHVRGNDSIITNLFYSCLFLLPYTIYQAWLFYNRLSFISYRKTWYLPEETSDMPQVTVFLNSLVIQIRMAPKYNAPEQVYETTVPGRISVGTMFTHFIKNRSNNDGEKETFEDADNQLFGWQFFVPAFLGMGKRMINPDVSLDKNKIKNGMVVFAKRIPK